MTLLSPPPTETVRDLAQVSTDPEHVRGAMGRFPSGVVALCAVVDGQPVGMIASSFSTGVSYSPPMVMFSVQNSSSTWPTLRAAERIGVSVLGAAQSAACIQLASRSRDRFDGLSITETDRGALLMDDAPMWLDCEIDSTTPVGDHQIVVLRVHATSVGSDQVPLVYHERKFHSLSAIG